MSVKSAACSGDPYKETKTAPSLNPTTTGKRQASRAHAPPQNGSGTARTPPHQHQGFMELVPSIPVQTEMGPPRVVRDFAHHAASICDRGFAAPIRGMGHESMGCAEYAAAVESTDVAGLAAFHGHPRSYTIPHRVLPAHFRAPPTALPVLAPPMGLPAAPPIALPHSREAKDRKHTEGEAPGEAPPATTEVVVVGQDGRRVAAPIPPQNTYAEIKRQAFASRDDILAFLNVRGADFRWATRRTYGRALESVDVICSRGRQRESKSRGLRSTKSSATACPVVLVFMRDRVDELYRLAREDKCSLLHNHDVVIRDCGGRVLLKYLRDLSPPLLHLLRMLVIEQRMKCKSVIAKMRGMGYEMDPKFMNNLITKFREQHKNGSLPPINKDAIRTLFEARLEGKFREIEEVFRFLPPSRCPAFLDALGDVCQRHRLAGAPPAAAPEATEEEEEEEEKEEEEAAGATPMLVGCSMRAGGGGGGAADGGVAWMGGGASTNGGEGWEVGGTRVSGKRKREDND